MSASTKPQSGGPKPDYGRRLFVNIVDERARNEPDREWLSIPKTSNPKDGYRVVTYAQAARGIDRVAHKLVKSSGLPDRGEFPTVAYIGPNDVRYLLFALGASKAGYKALFISTRNSMEGQLNLFELTDCNTLWFDGSFRAQVQSWLQERDMCAIMTMSIDRWLPEEPVEPFPYNKTFEEAEWEPLLLLHTSGSTGLPKPIVCRHGMLAVGDKIHHLPEFKGSKIWVRQIAEMAKKILHPSGLKPGIPIALVCDGR